MTQASAAPWWDNPGTDDTPVIAHTPDETQYWHPDDRQMERMRGGITSGVVIPRANNDGTSKGFYGPMAGVVHVDPDAPDGGAVVDLSQVNDGQLFDAFSQSVYPHQVYYNLTKEAGASPPVPAQAPAPAERPRVNPLVPDGSYVVPAARDDGTQTLLQGSQQVQEGPTMPMQPVPPLPGQPQAPVAQASPQQAPPQQAPPQQAPPQPVQPVAPAPAPQPAPQPAAWPMQQVQQQPPVAPLPPAPDNNQQVLAGLNQLTNVVGQLVNTMAGQQPQPAVPPVTHTQPTTASPTPLQSRRGDPRATQAMRPAMQPTSPMPAPQPMQREDDEEDFEPAQTLREMEVAAHQETQHGVIVGFETLEMPFITGPLPKKAKKSVLFEIPGSGTMSARYHAVSDGADCLALVYDTRYEDGNQYLPPDLGDKPLVVTLPRRGKGKQTARYLCSSMGLHFTVGVLDIVVLVKHHDQEVNIEDEDEDDED